MKLVSIPLHILTGLPSSSSPHPSSSHHVQTSLNPTLYLYFKLISFSSVWRKTFLNCQYWSQIGASITMTTKLFTPVSSPSGSSLSSVELASHLSSHLSSQLWMSCVKPSSTSMQTRPEKETLPLHSIIRASAWACFRVFESPYSAPDCRWLQSRWSLLGCCSRLILLLSDFGLGIWLEPCCEWNRLSMTLSKYLLSFTEFVVPGARWASFLQSKLISSARHSSAICDICREFWRVLSSWSNLVPMTNSGVWLPANCSAS